MHDVPRGFVWPIASNGVMKRFQVISRRRNHITIPAINCNKLYCFEVFILFFVPLEIIPFTKTDKPTRYKIKPK